MKHLGIVKTMVASAVAASFLLGSDAFGHSRITPGTDLPPRDPNTIGQRQAPCGGAARTNNVVELIAGSEATLRFQETRPHNGSFRIAFSPANDAGFDDNIILDNIPDVGNPQNGNPVDYEQKFIVPNVPCDACTIQHKFNLGGGSYYSCTDIKIVEVVQNQPPASVFAPSAMEGKAPFSVMFDGSASTDDTAIESYSWNFGDGSEAATGVTVNHTFTEAGEYTVTLTTADAEGLTNGATQSIKVLPADAFVAVVNSDVLKGITPLSVTLTAEESADIANYQWSVNGTAVPAYDGKASITHLFQEPKRNEVSLTITNQAGETDTKSIFVTSQYNSERFSPLEFAQVIYDDFIDLDNDNDGLVSFDSLKESFVTVDESVLNTIDTNTDSLLSEVELADYLKANGGRVDDDNDGDSAGDDDAQPTSLAAGAGGSLLLLLLGGLFSRRFTRK